MAMGCWDVFKLCARSPGQLFVFFLKKNTVIKVFLAAIVSLILGESKKNTLS